MPLMEGLAKRLMFSAVFISIALLAIFFPQEWLFFIVIEAFSLLALNEFLTLAEKKKIVINRIMGLCFGALIPVSVYFNFEPVVIATACLSLFIFNFHRQFREQALLSTAVTVFGIIYVSWFFSYFLRLRGLPAGSWWVFYSILLAKGGDAGAYFVGKKFGKVKLIEHISPNKSVEGAFGGFAVTLLLSLISKIYLPHVSFGHLLALGVLIGVLSQLGDLAESAIKRDVGVKDSGQVPGLGGVLDILDSLILCIPFVYYYIVTFV